MLPPHRRRRTVVWLLAACALLPRPSHAQEELLGELKTVAEVRFEGRRHVSARELRSVLKTRAPSIWPWREKPTLRLDFLRADTLQIAALYRHYGFLDAHAAFRVSSTRKPDEVAVTFEIHEGQVSRIRAVELGGVSAYPEDQLRKRLWARARRPFDPAFLQLDTLRISELYQERGYRPHMVAQYRRDSLDVTVRYDIHEGTLYRVGDVYIANPAATMGVRERLIRRELLLHPGDVYRRSRVDRSVERLYESGLFSQVQVTPIPDTTNTLIEFFFQVRERKPRWVDAGIGSGTSERFRFTGEWGHRNLGGRGLQGALGSRLTFYGDGRFQLWHSEASLLEPWLLRTRTRGQVTPFFERSDDVSAVDWTVRQEARGVRFQLRRELGRLSSVSLTQSNVFATQDVAIEPGAVVSQPVRDSLESAVVSSYATHSLGLGLERDYRDNPLDAMAGSVQALNAEIAGGPFHGKSSFRKAELVSAWYSPTRSGWVMASRVRVGIITPFGDTARFSPNVGANPVDREVARLPLENRFRAGGVNSIRGFEENEIAPSGGLAVLAANLELRIPVAGPLGLEVFADAGNVWARPRYIRWHQFRPRIGRRFLEEGEVRYVLGFGPRVKLPIGPLRIDFSWSLSPAQDPQGRPLGPGYGKMATQFAVGPSF